MSRVSISACSVSDSLSVAGLIAFRVYLMVGSVLQLVCGSALLLEMFRATASDYYDSVR